MYNERENPLNLDKFISLIILLRITAWAFRFVRIARSRVRKTDTLDADEHQSVMQEFWIRNIQEGSYGSKMKDIKCKGGSNTFLLFILWCATLIPKSL